MKNFIVTTLFLFVLLNSCKKKDNTLLRPPEVTVPDSTFKVQSVTIAEVNEATINCQISPPQKEAFTNVFLLWSSSATFSSLNDSMLLAENISAATSFEKKITALKQMTDYYARIKVNFRGKTYFSDIKQFKTDSLRIIYVFGLDTFPIYVNRNQTGAVFTNLTGTARDTMALATKVFLGKYECPVVEDYANVVLFQVPSAVLPGRYSLRLERKGLATSTPDSIDVLKGIWSYVQKPEIPNDPDYGNENGIGFYGTCQSPTKGYIIPGRYLRDTYYLDYGNPDFARPSYILEYDPITGQWARKKPVNPKCFENPICYYFDNSIYVIAGTELDMYNGYVGEVKDLYRLNLSTMEWTTVGPLPLPTTYNLVSFELNNEWYLGLGQDSSKRDICCASPLPTKKFWKYNPATNTWTQIADFPGTKFQAKPTGFQLGGKGYIFFGGLHKGAFDSYIDTEFDRELWRYDPAANTWTQLPLPSNGGPPQGEKYCIVTFNGKAYFLTAQVRELGSSFYRTSGVAGCMEYDPSTGRFERISYPNPVVLMQKVYQNGSTIILQADALGYVESNPNTSLKLILE